MITAAGMQATIVGTKLSAPTVPPLRTATDELIVVMVPAGAAAGDPVSVEYGDGRPGQVKVPAGLTGGETFHARAPAVRQVSPLLPPTARGAVVGLSIGGPLVLSPFLIWGGTATARVLAPACTLPVAALFVGVGAYYGQIEQEDRGGSPPDLQEPI